MKRKLFEHAVVASLVSLVGLMLGGVEGQTADDEFRRQRQIAVPISQDDDLIVSPDAVQGRGQARHAALVHVAKVGLQQVEATSTGREEALAQSQHLGALSVKVVGPVKLEAVAIVAKHGDVGARTDGVASQNVFEPMVDQAADRVHVSDAPVEKAGWGTPEATPHLERDLAVEAQRYVLVEHAPSSSSASRMAPLGPFVNPQRSAVAGEVRG